MNKKIFLFFIFFIISMKSCFVEDHYDSMKFLMKKNTFTTNDIKQKIVNYDNNIGEIEFTIDDNRASKKYDSKTNQHISVNPQTRAIFFELQKIKYKDPRKSQLTRISLKINNKIRNHVDDFSMPVYRLPGIKKEYKDENFPPGCFIIFSDFNLDKIFAQENVVFYYTKKDAIYSCTGNQEWTFKKNNKKYYITKKDENNVLMSVDARYEFFIENKDVSLKISDFLKRYWPSGFGLLFMGVLLYVKYNPQSKIAKLLSKEVI